MNMEPFLSGVLETCLYASDLRAATTFYRDVLRLDQVSSEPGRHVFFRCVQQMVLIFHPDATSDPGGTLPPHGAHGPGHVAFAVSAEQVDDWAERLRNHEIEIEKDVAWGEAGRSLYVRDPAGNSIELATPTIWPVEENG